MDGILLINKPKGLTSFQIVSEVRKKLQTRKVGHAGTLDPFATGVLVVLVGKATKMSDYLLTQDKEYIATSLIGASTDTLDEDGMVVATSNNLIKKDELLMTFTEFTGVIEQIPPKYSALKVDGKKLYEYARNNIEVEIKSREVNINYIDLLEFEPNQYQARASVSKGTYIRTLFSDINHKLNCESHLIDLQRTKSGQFLIEDCIEFEEIDAKHLISLHELLTNMYETLEITDEKIVKLAKNGNPILIENTNNEILITNNDEIIGIFQKKADMFKPKIMF